ncbi:MAG: thiol:disulfide interchange protein [Prevotella sp.]|jgi:thiol:disulfide interchange protein DsbD|nr:thiol:disulfide interchange protein [Prevotella sp.]
MNGLRKLLLTCWALITALALQAQIVDPIHFTSELKTGEGDEAEIVFHAKIDAGWHVYSTDLGSGGPTEATFNVVKMDGAEPVGKLTPRGKVIKKMDKLFDMELKYFENEATFVQKIRFTKPDYDIDCYLEYGACSDASCLPPSEVALKQQGKSPVASAPNAADKKTEDVAKTVPAATVNPLPEETVPTVAKNDTAKVDSTAISNHAVADDLWMPVTDELRALGSGEDLAKQSLLWLLLMGFVAGLLAVCMPCIWPIIPMTVSFFLKRSKDDKKKGIRDAFTYGISIIVIYLGLGLLVTALFGSDTLNAMSTNAVFNVFLFVLLVVFALSFFGWFEITLPEGWANAVDMKASETSGLISIFLMAFTLVLVSFSCTGPIIGMLLVQTTTTGNWLAPAVGMFGFALALALPFTLFAMFPSWLKSAPKSGSWMTTLKVVLGFIELAFSLKFLSVADLAYGWHILDREVFLSLWIVIFALLGAYLCGWLKFQADEIGGEMNKPMPVVCIMGGLVSLAFAVYMVPGLWGAPCKAVSAFAPPMNTQDFNLNPKVVEAEYLDYESGMAVARAQGKPVFIDFTGFGCVNCRKMEAAVWSDARVADKLKNDYVLISLYVDDKTPLKEPFEITDETGNKKTLRTVGAKWSYLQSHKFGANAQPFYVALDPVTGKPLTGSRGFNEDVAAYMDFLNQGLRNYQQQ